MRDSYVFRLQFSQHVVRNGGKLAKRVLEAPHASVDHLAKREDALHHHRPPLLKRVLEQRPQNSVNNYYVLNWQIFRLLKKGRGKGVPS
jgi:hypothetical protein